MKTRKLVSWLLVITFVVSAIPILVMAEEGLIAEVDFDLSDLIYFDDDFEPFDFEAYLAELYLTDFESYQNFRELQRLSAVQHYAIVAYNQLMSHFLTETNEGNILIYSEHYAGAFIDYDTLVVQLTDLSDSVIAFYTSLFEPNAPIRFIQVNFSLNELIAFGEVFVDALKEANLSVTSFGFDTMRNTYSIGLDQNSLESLQMMDIFSSMSRFMDIPVDFELEEKAVGYSGLTGGSRMHFTGGAGGFSLGITGYALYGGRWVPALMTTGHAFIGARPGQLVIHSAFGIIGHLGGYRVGDFDAVSSGFGPGRFGPTNGGDWAVVILNSLGSQLMTNQVQTGQRITSQSNGFMPVNAVVFGSGFQTPFYSGRILHATGRNIEMFFVTTTGLVRTTVRNLAVVSRDPRINPQLPVGGDSGGTIFTDVGIDFGFPGINSFAGVLAGGNESGTMWFYSPFHINGGIFRPRLTP